LQNGYMSQLAIQKVQVKPSCIRSCLTD